MGERVDNIKPADGKEITVDCAKTVFLSDGTMSTHILPCNIKGTWSGRTISFFPQEENKIGIHIRIVDLVEFLKTVSETDIKE